MLHLLVQIDIAILHMRNGGQMAQWIALLNHKYKIISKVEQPLAEWPSLK